MFLGNGKGREMGTCNHRGRWWWMDGGTGRWGRNNGMYLEWGVMSPSTSTRQKGKKKGRGQGR